MACESATQHFYPTRFAYDGCSTTTYRAANPDSESKNISTEYYEYTRDSCLLSIEWNGIVNRTDRIPVPHMLDIDRSVRQQGLVCSNPFPTRRRVFRF